MERITRDERRFNRDETADIFDLASALDGSNDLPPRDLSIGDLHRIADELGISAAAVDAAIREIARRRHGTMRESRRSVRRRMRFIRHVAVYVIVVGMFAIIDALGGGGWWFFYIAGLWGILLALHALRFVTRRNGPLERQLASG